MTTRKYIIWFEDERGRCLYGRYLEDSALDAVIRYRKQVPGSSLKILRVEPVVDREFEDRFYYLSNPEFTKRVQDRVAHLGKGLYEHWDGSISVGPIPTEATKEAAPSPGPRKPPRTIIVQEYISNLNEAERIALVERAIAATRDLSKGQ